MRHTLTRALLLCLVGLILTTLLLAGAPPSALAVNTYQSKILETFGDDLIAYWPLNEVSGTTAYDVSGNGYNGTYNGVTLDQVDGPGETMGRAGLWDGINDLVNVDAVKDYVGTPPVSVAGWAIYSPVSSSYLFDAGPSRRAIYQFTLYADHHRLDLYNGAGVSPGAPPPPAGWFSWIGIFTDAGSELIINGETIGTNTTPSLSGNVEAVRIGSNNGSHESWSGNIAHVIVIARPLTPEDIAIISDNSPLPEVTPTPTALPLSHHMTLPSGQPVRLDYSATAGEMLIGTLILVTIGLVAFLVFLGLAKRP